VIRPRQTRPGETLRIQTKPNSFAGLSSRQARSIPLVLGAKSIAEGCKAAQISTVTWYAWLQDDGFREMYRDVKRQAFESSLARLQVITAEAVETLREVATDQKAPPSSRVSAARSILETAFKAVELGEMEERLSELEKFIQKGRQEW